MSEKYKVLLIEDEKIDQMAFKRFVELESLPYDYVIAESIAETKKLINSNNYNIIIADYSLADGTALEIFDLQIDSPIIIVTGSGDEEIAVKAMKLGAYDYLIKDLDRNYLKILPITVKNTIQRKKAEDESKMMSYAIMNINDSVYFTDNKDKIIFVNDAFCNTYNYTKEEIIGMESKILWNEKSFKVFKDKILTKNVSVTLDEDYYHKRKNASEFPVSITLSSLQYDKRNNTTFVHVIRNITERKTVEETLLRLSLLDGLTGIGNRRNFDDTIKYEWSRALRSSSYLALIMIDVDYFKKYNDNYGHQAGDECLKQVSKAIKSRLRRPGDFVARYGGEEFAVILPNTNLESAKFVADSLREKIEKLKIPHEHSEVCDYITISLGVSAINPNGNYSPENLISSADQSLYKAKQEGRNTVKLSDK